MIYLAGSLFTEAEIAQRKAEGIFLEYSLEQNKIDKVVFNPIEQPFNDKTTLPTAEQIFRNDNKQIEESDVFFFNFDNPSDAGVFMEFGQVYERWKIDKSIKVYVVLSDIRVSTAGEYDGVRVPYGFNQYVIGSCKQAGFKIHPNFGDALEQFIKDHM